MPRKPQNPPLVVPGLIDWPVSTRHVLGKDGNYLAVGKELRYIKLGSPDFHEQLLNDFRKVKTDADVLEWINMNGFLTEHESRRNYTDAVSVLQRAANIRWLVRLIRAVRETEYMNYLLLKEWATNKKISASALRISFPIKEDEQFLNDWKGLFFDEAINIAVVDDDFESVSGVAFKIADVKNRFEWCLQSAARQCLRVTINRMINGAGIVLEGRSTSEDKWSLRPSYVARTPWQAIGLAAMQQVCESERLCENPNCRRPIEGTAARHFCDLPKCQKWYRRNIGSVRKGGR